MANLGDISKIKLPNGNVVNIKDATARAQANWNTNNGVKNFATENNFSYTGYYKDVPVDGSLTGNVTVYIGNITSTDTDANKCAVLFMYTDDMSSLIHLVNRGTSSSFSANLEANVLKSIRIYPSDNYVHSSGDTVTVTNLMVCPKSLYDADSTYEPYALPNTKITPELIELVDSGAKNLCNNTLATGTISSNVTATVSTDKQVTLSGTAPSNADASFTISTNTQFPAGTYIGSGCPSGGATDKYRIDYVVNDSTVYRDTGNGVEFTLNSASNVRSQIVVYRGNAAPSAAFKPMLCSKSAWDVSRKYVPYAMSNAELTKLTPIMKKALVSMPSDYGLINDVTHIIPPKTIVRISVLCDHNNSNPTGIVVSLSNDSSNYQAKAKLLAKTEMAEWTQLGLSTSAMFTNNSVNPVSVYFWAKYATVSNNYIITAIDIIGDV